MSEEIATRGGESKLSGLSVGQLVKQLIMEAFIAAHTNNSPSSSKIEIASLLLSLE